MTDSSSDSDISNTAVTNSTKRRPSVDSHTINMNEEPNLEDQKWAMLAGQAAFNLQSHIFKAVLPTGLIKPHIFPRNISDMERMIEKYKNTKEEARLENAEQKWQELKCQIKWKKEHERVLEQVKSAYMHIAHPLEVLMKLPVDQKNNPDDIKTAFRAVLPSNLKDRGDEMMDMLSMIGNL